MEKKKKYIIVASILIIACLCFIYSIYATQNYDLLCEKAGTLKEYSDCIRFEYALNN